MSILLNLPLNSDAILAYLSNIVVFGVIIYFIQKNISDRKKEAKLKAAYNKKLLESKEEIKSIIEDTKQQMYSFAYTQKKMSLLIYDIEEGGQYLSDYEKSHCAEIDKIIETELRAQSVYFFQLPTMDHYFPRTVTNETMNRIKNKINNLPERASRIHIGFS